MDSTDADEGQFAVTPDGDVAFAVPANADADDGGGTVIVSWQDYSAFADDHPEVGRLEIDSRSADAQAVEKLAEAASDSGHDVDFSVE